MKICCSILIAIVLGSSCLAGDMKPSGDIKPDRLKVDAEGNYLPFPGITVVSDIADEDLPFFESLQQRLMQVKNFSNYYSLLPLSSYHLTSLNLETKFPNLDKDWDEFISRKLFWFRHLNQHIVDANLSARVSLASIRGLTGLSIEVKVDQAFRNKTTKLAQEFDLEKKVPVFFHIGLGYLKNEISKVDHGLMLQEINKVFNNLLEEKGYLQKILTLKQANLSYFPDMTAFIPWNAQNNP